MKTRKIKIMNMVTIIDNFKKIILSTIIDDCIQIHLTSTICLIIIKEFDEQDNETTITISSNS